MLPALRTVCNLCGAMSAGCDCASGCGCGCWEAMISGGGLGGEMAVDQGEGGGTRMEWQVLLSGRRVR